MKYDIIIIGAGAAGLMAMKDLLEAGYSVCLLEASATAGGRIVTISEDGFDQPVETGAEFVHGKLPLTLALLDKANISYVPVEGKMMTVQKGEWHKNEAHNNHWNAFMRKLSQLKADMSIAHFLAEYFPGHQYEGLRKAVQGYSEGFDLADINKASAMAAQREWSEENETQYRISGGYVQLIDFLLHQCRQQKAVVHFSTVATSIDYDKGSVRVHTSGNLSFEATALLITVSAGILQSGTLEFSPALDTRYAAAIRQLGFGSVIKILMQFKTAFWKNYSTNIGFILSDEMIRTWWTQLPSENNLLTGWLGGPPALERSNDTEESLLQSSLLSLSTIFNLPTDVLKKELVQHKISCWQRHPYVRGGYSYNTLESDAAKKILSHPVAGTIFFAGEAVYDGQSQGTVEAALQSGRNVVKKIKEMLEEKEKKGAIE